MLQLTAAGIRAGSSALGSPASGAALALESLGDSTSEPVPPRPSLGSESPGDSSSEVPSSDPFFEPRLACESPGDSEAEGDPEGLAGELDGDACGEESEPPDEPAPLPPGAPPPEPVGVGDGLDEEPDPPDPLPPEPPDPPPPEPPLPPDGEDVGDGDGDEPGAELAGSDGVGVAVGVAWCTGGETLGETAPVAPRSCCQDQPTEPPAGTVSEPAEYDE